MKLEEFEFWNNIGAPYELQNALPNDTAHRLITEKYHVVIQTYGTRLAQLIITTKTEEPVWMWFGAGCPVFNDQTIHEMSHEVFDHILTELKNSGAGNFFDCSDEIRDWACGTVRKKFSNT